MVRMPLKRVRGELFSPKTRLFRLDMKLQQSKPYFKLKLRSLSKFLQKRLFFKTQKVAATGYYGIEDPFPDLIFKTFQNFAVLGGYEMPIVGCQDSPVVRIP